MFEPLYSGSKTTVINEHLKYSGSGTQLAFLMFKNLALTILTLGIYAAWGRTNTRRYIWGNVSFLGDRAAYTGTGKELFRGWLLVVAVYIVVAVLANIISKIHPLFILPIIPFYIYVYAIAIYGGTRYRLSRTKWRETAFTMQRSKESTQLFVWICVKGLLLTGLTLGIYLPVFQNDIRSFLTNRAGFGTLKFNYDGKNGEFWRLCFWNFFLTFITFGFYGPWMLLNLTKFKLQHSNLNDSLHFDINLKGSEVFVFGVVSYLLTVFSLGLAIPWMVNWGYSLFVNAIHVTGEIDFTSIRNIEADENPIGDVIAVEYDLDLGF